MENGGVFPFTGPNGEDDFVISSDGEQIGVPVTDLEGIEALSLYAQFSVGTASTGAMVQLYIQSSFAGAPYYDIACIAFEDDSAVKVVNLNSDPLTTPATVTDGELADNTVVNGAIGDRLRAKVITTGDFTGPTLLSVRGHAR